MKSSSSLFPVSLLKADLRGELSEDVYLIKHNRDQDKSVQIALSHLALVDQPASRGPLVLVHGSFSNRSFWLSYQGIGLARHLLDEGYDLWLMEHRGHGLSPRNKDYQRNTLERYVRFDVSAVNEFVQEQTGRLPFWLGHSLGGAMAASALASGVLHGKNCKGIITFGTQLLRRPWYFWLPFTNTLLRTVVRYRGELDGQKLQIGPENEPASLINEHLARQGYLGSWHFKEPKQKLLPIWKSFNPLPILAVVGAADKSNPARHCLKFAKLYGGPHKTTLLLGKKAGFSRDYGHVDMLVSKEAAQEVWPRISAWLADHE